MTTLSELASQYVENMTSAGHDSTWGEFRTDDGRRGFIFIATMDPTSRAAIETLGAAGLLCETPLSTGGDCSDHLSTPLTALVTALRALGR